MTLPLPPLQYETILKLDVSAFVLCLRGWSQWSDQHLFQIQTYFPPVGCDSGHLWGDLHSIHQACNHWWVFFYWKLDFKWNKVSFSSEKWHGKWYQGISDASVGLVMHLTMLALCELVWIHKQWNLCQLLMVIMCMINSIQAVISWLQSLQIRTLRTIRLMTHECCNYYCRGGI